MTVGLIVRVAVVAAFVAGLVGGAARVLGLDGPHAITVGCGVFAVAFILLTQRSVVPPADLEPPDVDPPTGGRRDLEQLAWSMVEHRDHIRGIAIARVRTVAARRLAEHGLDVERPEDDRAIAALLGADAWAVLRPDREKPVTPRAFDAALRAVERLPPPEPLGPARAIPEDRTSRAD
ncbi:hypothetical protein [Amnibacterium kyonggiense]|uniref:Uncharacterized protein n=1 Tax=Amnibacterium kyonggiense TaxID=595671 RepID=A0A4R7FST1_9MICO|nr:hypothetical protein [Amnibacterium kyonggiense]TDS80900.1 hypothetical protein CLV52_1471 [Amnibacterium kyonggiense]